MENNEHIETENIETDEVSNEEPKNDTRVEEPKYRFCDGFCWDCERRTWCWASSTKEHCGC